MKPQTKAIRIQTPQTSNKEHSSPLYLTSSFCFENADEMRAVFADEIDAHIYSRFSNPNFSEFTEKMAALENGETAIATSSGMSAISSTFLSLLKQGDHLLSCSSIFGSTHTIITKYLPNYGIDTSYFNAHELDSLHEHIRENTKMVFIESPTNPGLEIIDIDKLSIFCKKNNLILVVDNCFATPIGQRPLELGADIVVHSGTKWLDGQGRVNGGVIIGSKKHLDLIYSFCRSFGPSISPFNAWLLSKSIETLDVRMERHASNALYIATQLENNSKISWIRYPFLQSFPQYNLAKKQMHHGGGIICFELKNGLSAGQTFLNNLKILSLTANLGDTRSIASHPASTTHAKLSESERMSVGITPGLIRISVGLEDKDDILYDILNSLNNL